METTAVSPGRKPSALWRRVTLTGGFISLAFRVCGQDDRIDWGICYAELLGGARGKEVAKNT